VKQFLSERNEGALVQSYPNCSRTKSGRGLPQSKTLARIPESHAKSTALTESTNSRLVHYLQNPRHVPYWKHHAQPHQTMLQVKDTLRSTVNLTFDGRVFKVYHGPNARERFNN